MIKVVKYILFSLCVSNITNETVTAMCTNNLAKDMEELCMAEQSVMVAQLSGITLQEEKQLLKKQVQVFREKYAIFLGNEIIKNAQNFKLLQSLVDKLSLIVTIDSLELEEQVEKCKSAFVDATLYFEHDKVISFLSSINLKIEDLSEVQKTAIAMFITQLDKNELCVDFSHFFVGGAINALSNYDDLKSPQILKLLDEKVPLNFLEDSDYGK